MRFIQFLIEQPGQPQQYDWVTRQVKNARGRQRRANQKRGQQNKQAMKLPQRPAGEMQVLDPNTGKQVQQRKQSPAGPQRSPTTTPDTVEYQYLSPELVNLAKNNRQDAIEMQSLLGAMYNARRRNPQVEMTPPQIVTQSKNKQSLMALFKIAKDMQLPELAKVSEEIKNVAAIPGTSGQQTQGGQQVPQTPGQTPGEKTMLQKVFDVIQQASKNLSPQAWNAVRKRIDKAANKAQPNPPTKPQMPAGKPVVTQG